jgi:hypothetical protein
LSAAAAAAGAAAAVATRRVQMVVKHGREEEAAAAGGAWHNTRMHTRMCSNALWHERPHCAQHTLRSVYVLV